MRKLAYGLVMAALFLVGCAANQPQPETLEERAYVVAESMVGVAKAANRMRDRGILSAEVHNDLLDDLSRANDKLTEARELAKMGQSDIAYERLEFARQVLTYVQAELEARNDTDR